MVTHQVTLNNHEYEVPYQVCQVNDQLVFRADPSADSGCHAPNLTYYLKVTGADFSVSTGALLLEGTDEDDASLLVLSMEQTDRFTLDVCGSVDGSGPSFLIDAAAEMEQYRRQHAALLNGFRLNATDSHTQALQTMVWWFAHNMRVHYQSPHGLEQSGGAAWGTRDVSQGPMEFLLATGHFDAARAVLQRLFAHQYE
ncbi:cellobiose phosphorylase, partial [Fischerella thermalis CCMEE 5273]